MSAKRRPGGRLSHSNPKAPAALARKTAWVNPWHLLMFGVAILLVAAITLLPSNDNVTATAAVNDSSNSIVLQWIAPGDDADGGTASQYDLRYATSLVTNSNWNSASQVSGEPTPLPAGTTQSMTITGLHPSTTYYFALKSADEVPNWSSLSFVTQATTAVDPNPPASCTESWSCADWGACSADGNQTRTCTDANSCGTTANKPALSQSCTPALTPTPTLTCTESWSCASWSTCSSNGSQARTCTDNNACGTTTERPALSQSCTPDSTTAPNPSSTACTESWSCSTWLTCGLGGLQYRSCSESNGCGTTADKPATSQSCQRSALDQIITPTTNCATSWSCSSWSPCAANNKQARTCTDANACGTTAGRPSEQRKCPVGLLSVFTGETEFPWTTYGILAGVVLASALMMVAINKKNISPK